MSAEKTMETADRLLQNATTIDMCNEAYQLYSSIAAAVDVKDRIQKVREKAEEILRNKAVREGLIRSKIVGLRHEFDRAQKRYEKWQEERRINHEALTACKKNIAEAEKRLTLFSGELTNTKGIFSARKRKELTRIIDLEKENIEKGKRDLAEAESVIREMNSQPAVENPDPKELTYKIARFYLDENMINESVSEFEKIKGYKDVDEILLQIKS